MLFYAVTSGRTPAIYTNVQEAEHTVRDYRRPNYAAVKTLKEATEYMNEHGYPNNSMTVYHEGLMYNLMTFCTVINVPTPAQTTCKTLFDIGYADVRVEATQYHGSERVDIRKWEGRIWEATRDSEGRRNHDDTQMKRTTKGISLTVQQWDALINIGTDIVADFTDLHHQREVNKRYYLGDDVYATINTPYLVMNIRRWYEDKNERVWKPSRKGIAIPFSAWDDMHHLRHVMRAIHEQPINTIITHRDRPTTLDLPTPTWNPETSTWNT